MKSKTSSTNNLDWTSSTLNLAPKGTPSKSLQKLFDAGVEKLLDLLWIFPLRVLETPKVKPFNSMVIDELFLGNCKLMSLRLAPAYGRKGRGRVQLFNATAEVLDLNSNAQTTLKFFNTYPSFKKQLETMESFTFLGTPSEFKGMIQIINPKINPTEIGKGDHSKIIDYPTISGVPGKELKKLIDRIPAHLWNNPPSNLLIEQRVQADTPDLMKSFKILHGLENGDKKSAQDRIIREEFFEGQLRVLARKLKNRKLSSKKLIVESKRIDDFRRLFPYDLTDDQNRAIRDIQNDLKQGYPMMRMIQGDVGSGKTTVALIGALVTIDNSSQVALMCPTETLALQHFQTIKNILKDDIEIDLLLGSLKPSEKKKIYSRLKSGETKLVIGTHSLIQKSVVFNDLQLAIIDEQHKFGVNQRQELFKKGSGVHTLIMSATPIPRTLQLAQYGDLEISTIRTMPTGRKGTRTRVITKSTYEKYLSFIRTRISLGEQVYVVVPAIEESETMNLKNVEGLVLEYKKFFPDLKIATLHGQLSSSEKSEVMSKFEKNQIDILISTTVIEVGINVLNSTVISIYNPDRFGLSSLHQLRGRVGRGEKPGFCFLLAIDNISKESLDRIKIIEKTTDGFEISEADLGNRGAGNLFGASQSGHISSYRLANIIEHFNVFEEVTREIEDIREKYPEKLNNVLLELTEDTKITATI